MSENIQEDHIRIAFRQAMKYILDNGERMVSQAGKQPPDQVVIGTVVPLMQNIYASAKSAGVDVSTEAILSVTVHVIRAVIELFIMAGIIKESEAESFAAKVTQGAIQKHNGGMQ